MLVSWPWDTCTSISPEWPDEDNLNRMQRSMQKLLYINILAITGIYQKAN
jgi:hypothetical protein